jgi:putative transposase
VEVTEPFEFSDIIGIDLGVTNIAVDSDGEIFRGTHINNVRIRYAKLRAKLQRKGTKSSKRLLRKRNRRESRFAKDLNHCISKKVVKKAERTSRGIALENLMVK